MLIDENRIFLDTNFTNKEEIFEFIGKEAFNQKLVKDQKLVAKDFFEREKQISTGLQDGFAIPHCRSENVTNSAVFFIRNKNTIEWETLDGSEVKNIIAIVVPNKGTENIYLKIIANIATELLEDEFKMKLTKAENKLQVLKLFNEEDKK